MMVITVSLPLRLVSESNAHEHWRKRQKRAKEQRSTALWSVRGALLAEVAKSGLRLDALLSDSYVVTLTRIAPRPLDSDNAVGACKHVRDGVADAMGIDDRNPLVDWRYGQRRGCVGEYAVEIRIERMETVAAMSDNEPHSHRNEHCNG